MVQEKHLQEQRNQPQQKGQITHQHQQPNHNQLQQKLQRELQVLEMPHQFKQEQEEWHVQHQNQMEL